MPAAPGLRLERIALVRGARPLFDELSLTLAGGRWHALLGRSGVGKSSLLALLAGLCRADAGTVVADDGGALGPRVARMAQDDGLLPWLTVLENVRLGPRLRGRRGAADRARAHELLRRVGLAEWAQARPGTLSGGMRQRVALARTLLEERPIVLLDEPFSRLDALTREALQRLAAELLGARTVVLVTHDPLEAARLAHTATLLHGGVPTRTTTVALAGEPPRDPHGAATAARARELHAALADPAGASRRPVPAG